MPKANPTHLRITRDMLRGLVTPTTTPSMRQQEMKTTKSSLPMRGSIRWRRGGSNDSPKARVSLLVSETVACPLWWHVLTCNIGNLSCERVSKREVFDVFSKFGRLAQISLKNAYGFVQYHTIEEGLAAIRGCRDIELGGRAISK